jgi:coenzyme F420-reducing hydrogenase delta subunit
MKTIQMCANRAYAVDCIKVACYYKQGNFRAMERAMHVHNLFEEIGLEGDRVRMHNLSSDEGLAFAAYSKEITEYIKKLGPYPLKMINSRT